LKKTFKNIVCFHGLMHMPFNVIWCHLIAFLCVTSWMVYANGWFYILHLFCSIMYSSPLCERSRWEGPPVRIRTKRPPYLQWLLVISWLGKVTILMSFNVILEFSLKISTPRRVLRQKVTKSCFTTVVHLSTCNGAVLRDG
jgi:hypothetical protein